MAKIITEKELQREVDDLKQRTRRDQCPTEFSGKDLEEFFACFQKGDILETIPLYDNSLKRLTVALKIKRGDETVLIMQRGKVPGD